MLPPIHRVLCATFLLGLVASAADAHPVARPGLAPAAFATIPLPVQHTRYDARWSRVLNSRIGTNAISERASHLGGMERLQSVNTSTNRAIAYRQDRTNESAGDHWSNAGQTMARGFGDCEDYAIAKMQLLTNAGVPATDIFMVVGNNALGSAHAMLLVRQAGRFWVLDSLSNQIRLAESYTHFRPIISFGARGVWIHGYAVGTAPRDVARRASTPRIAANDKLASVIARQYQR